MNLIEMKSILSWTGGPAFGATHGIIRLCGPQALDLGLEPGLALASLLPEAELPGPGQSPRELSLFLRGRHWQVRVLWAEGSLLCFLRPDRLPAADPNDRSLLRTAGTIRQSLQEMTSALNGLSDAADLLPAATEPVSLALRSVYRLRRTAENLELYARLRSGSYTLRESLCRPAVETAALCGECWELLKQAGLDLSWDLPREERLLRLDWPLVSAMIREMITNAAANTADGKVRLTLRFGEGQRLRCTVENRCNGPLPEVLFHRHAAEQGDLRSGLGLGLGILAAGAACHNGSFLLSSDGAGVVTALLSVTGSLGGTTLEQTCFLPDLPDCAALQALSPLLPTRAFAPEGLLY